jgi:hypothetical protein
MREYFKPWRRKAGCVSLAMSLYLVLLWLRGNAITDHLCFGDSDDDCHWLSASCDGVTWYRSKLSHEAGWYQSNWTAPLQKIGKLGRRKSLFFGDAILPIVTSGAVQLSPRLNHCAAPVRVRNRRTCRGTDMATFEKPNNSLIRP